MAGGEREGVAVYGGDVVTRIISFDPSTVGAHWAVLDVASDLPRPRFVACGEAFWNGGLVETMREAYAPPAGSKSPWLVFAVETPAGYIFEKARAKHLLASANMAGKLAGAALSLGYDVFEMPAAQWRLLLCGRARRAGSNLTSAAGDDEVKRALIGVEGMPTRTNAHVRDAMGLAIVAGRTRMLSERRPA